MKILRRGWFFALALLCADRAEAQLFQGPYGTGGTWNIYEVVLDPLQWIDALDDAQSRTQQGVTGNLVSLHSLEENLFVHGIAGGGDVWIGLTDREGMAPSVINGGAAAPQESAGLGSPLTQGWAWTSGEPFAFQNFGGGEPNDVNGEDAAHIRGDGRWNDHQSGLGFDDPIGGVLQPGTAGDESGGPTFKYVVEYNTFAGSPFAGIANPGPPTVFPPERLGGPQGIAGNWSIIEYRGQFTAQEPASNVIRQIRDIENGDLDADVFTAEVPWLDITDPDTNGAGGPILNNTLGNGMFTYPSDQAGVDDDDIISVAHARIRVPESGQYTFQVRSDDGFAMRIFGAEFSEVAGAGSLDPISRNTIQHAANTGDSNTQAVVNLPAGEYNVEFMSWERGGGAFYELTAAKGNFISDANAGVPQWLAVGDPRVVPEIAQGVPPVRLVGNATVATVSEAQGGNAANDIELAREIVLEGIGGGTAQVREDVNLMVIKDEGDICCGRPGNSVIGDAFLFPINDPALGGVAADQNNFSSGFFGKLLVNDGDNVQNEELLITFGIFSDDGSSFRVVGEDFLDVNATGGELFDFDGDDSLVFRAPTGNSNMLGTIILTEGVEYDWEGFQYEAGGDAGYEVWAAIGEHLDGFNNDFRVLSNTGTVFARNVGFQLVPEIDGILGDFNSNGVLDSGDLDELANAMMMNDAAFDLNGDGNVNIDDRLVWVRDLKGTWMGDADLNGEFNSGDFVRVFQAGKFETGQGATWDQGDWNGDKVFNSSDFVTAFQDGGFENGPRGAVAAVPEPGTATMMLLGLLSLMGVTRRR
jgi:hypothetical protein